MIVMSESVAHTGIYVFKRLIDYKFYRMEVCTHLQSEGGNPCDIRESISYEFS